LSEFTINGQKTTHLLPDYPFKPHYVQSEGVRIHYIDEGNANGPIILFLHGVPTWSFTFRKIIPECVAAGNRVIAPDLPGFGKSDKLFSESMFSLRQMIDWTEEFIWRLELKKIYLVAHDWGAIIGLIIAARHPERFSGIIACNGMLPVIDQKVPPFFQFWKFFCRYSPILPVGRIIDFGCNNKLTRSEREGYDYPFSKSSQKTAIRLLPELIPLKMVDTDADLILESWKLLVKFEKPFLTVFSNSDPITKGGEKILQQRIPGTKNQPHRILQGKHFLQEDAPEELSRIINEFVNSNQ
jgi:haloalkane dehalogenase